MVLESQYSYSFFFSPRTDYGRRGGHNPEPCPICVKELGSGWAVLQVIKIIIMIMIMIMMMIMMMIDDD